MRLKLASVLLLLSMVPLKGFSAQQLDLAEDGAQGTVMSSNVNTQEISLAFVGEPARRIFENVKASGKYTRYLEKNAQEIVDTEVLQSETIKCSVHLKFHTYSCFTNVVGGNVERLFNPVTNK